MFELFYADGGHYGPFTSIENAIGVARSRIAGRRSLQAVDVRERNDSAPGGFGATVCTIRREALTVDSMTAVMVRRQGGVWHTCHCADRLSAYDLRNLFRDSGLEAEVI